MAKEMFSVGALEGKMTAKAEWTCTRRGGHVKHEWNGYIIVTSGTSDFRWWVIQGEPAPITEKFNYINDAKEACEVAFRGYHLRAKDLDTRPLTRHVCNGHVAEVYAGKKGEYRIFCRRCRA